VAFQDLNPFPMKIISQKREYHRKSLKVMRKKDKADVRDYNWTWVVALEGLPSRWLNSVWQLRGGLECHSGKMRNIAEVPGESCHPEKGLTACEGPPQVVKLCMAVVRATTSMLFPRHFWVFLSFHLSCLRPPSSFCGRHLPLTTKPGTLHFAYC
jgi:hypothetical protein